MEGEDKFSVDTENIKNETKDTYKKVKEQIKDVNFKNDAKETSGFLKELFYDPVLIVKKVAKEEDTNLKKIIFLTIVFLIESLIVGILSLMHVGTYHGFVENALDLILSIINPLLIILIPSIIVLMFNKNNKKSLITIISTMVVVNIPTMLNKIVAIVSLIFLRASIITSPLSSMLTAVTIIFEYYGIKTLFGKEDEDFVKEYAVIKLATVFILYLIGKFL